MPVVSQFLSVKINIRIIWGVDFLMAKWITESVVIVFITLFVSACSNEQESSKEGQIQEQVENKTETVNNEKTSKATSIPVDQGDLTIWFEGEYQFEEGEVVVKGKTNLLPGANLILVVDSEEGTLIGTSDRTKVDEQGMFELETALPTKLVNELKGMISLKVKFDPRHEEEQIKNHYTGKMTGDFIRKESEQEEAFEVAMFQHDINIDDGAQTVAIETPQWNIPDDYGETNIRMDVEAIPEGNYVAVHVKSNIIDGTHVRADIYLPNHITWGYNGVGVINPDGSATIYVKNPEKSNEMKGISNYEVAVRMDTGGNNGLHVKEVYGENGEKLQGNLVEEEQGQEKYYIEKRITVPLNKQ